MSGCARKQDSKRLWDRSLPLLRESRSWRPRQLSFTPENPPEWAKGRPVKSAGVIPLLCCFIPPPSSPPLQENEPIHIYSEIAGDSALLE